MLDIAQYRRADRLARQATPTWRYGQRHFSRIFQQEGFPSQVESIADLTQLLSTMQEDRFGPYMTELDGLSDDDLALFLDVLADHAHFVADTFQVERVHLPLDTMISSLALYKKLCGWRPDFESILELGPGCGYLAFFLKRHMALKSYHQIDATESLYMLQHLVNRWCFKANVRDYAAYRAHDDQFAFGIEHDAQSVEVKRRHTAFHYPWWEIGRLADQQFDVITANAVLNEMTDKALTQYLELFAKVLKPDGALIIECFGGFDGTVDPRMTWQTLHRLKFAPLVLVNRGPAARKEFVVANAVYVREGHPNFEKLYAKQPGATVFSLSEPTTQRMYFAPPDVLRRQFTAVQIADLVRTRLTVDKASVRHKA